MSEDKITIENQPIEPTEEVNVDLDEIIADDISDEELMQFYEENRDAIDIMGGLDMFESLMALSDEQFQELHPAILQVFSETLEDSATERELMAMVLSQNYTSERAEEDFKQILEAIDTIDFLSEIKKDFLKQVTMLSMNKLQTIINHSAPVIQIPCELTEGTKIPIYAHDNDAAMDIYSPAEYTINPGEVVVIPTGIKMAIPDGYAILIQPRSGQSVKTKLRIANTPGLIDAGYRDEIGVIVENIEPPFKDIDYFFDPMGEIHIKSILHGESFTIAPGQRFAQMRLVQVPKANFVEVESVSEIGDNRLGGFGSSGLM